MSNKETRLFPEGNSALAIPANLLGNFDQANCNEIELDLEDESNRTYLGKNNPIWKINDYNTKCLLIPFIVTKPMKSTIIKQVMFIISNFY